MNNLSKRSKTAINLMIAIVLSLVLNFSYLVLLMVGNQREPTPEPPRQVATEEIIVQESSGNDNEQSIELSPSTIDSLKSEVIIREESIINSHRQHTPTNPMTTRRGMFFMLLDFLFYCVVTMAFLSIMTNTRKRNFYRRIAETIILLLVCYLLAPQMTWRGDIIITANTHHLFNPLTMLKMVTVLIAAVLYGKIFELLYAKQKVEMENERLKNENLTWQYNTLVNQVNPHFLFNSLNSLSMLVRESKNDDAVTYIARMSDTYRYIIEEGKAEKTTVESELRFLDAYRYMLEIRYAGKLLIEVDVERELYNYQMPPLSIQPLIENAVKHNTITSSKPLKITITSEGDQIVVSNPIHPKLEPEESTGIGLKNLSSRYELVVGRKIEVINNNREFIVRLPINKSTK